MRARARARPLTRKREPTDTDANTRPVINAELTDRNLRNKRSPACHGYADRGTRGFNYFVTVTRLFDRWYANVSFALCARTP